MTAGIRQMYGHVRIMYASVYTTRTHANRQLEKPYRKRTSRINTGETTEHARHKKAPVLIRRVQLESVCDPSAAFEDGDGRSTILAPDTKHANRVTLREKFYKGTPTSTREGSK